MNLNDFTYRPENEIQEPKIGRRHLDSSVEDDQLIWNRFQCGNNEALIHIYKKYAEILFNYGCQFTNSRELVRDSIQELFFDLIKRRKNLGKVLSIKAYLFKAVKRKVISIRNHEREIEYTYMQVGEFEMIMQSGFTSISQSSDREDIKTTIEGYLNQLPIAQREVLLLYFYEDLSYEEIADIFDVKVKSIRTKAYRALSSLSRLMKSKDSIY